MLTYDAAGPHQSRLLRTKFKDEDYVIESRPVANENDALIVNFGISLLQIRDVVNKTFIVTFVFVYSYKP